MLIDKGIRLIMICKTMVIIVGFMNLINIHESLCQVKEKREDSRKNGLTLTSRTNERVSSKKTPLESLEKNFVFLSEEGKYK